MPKLIDYLMHRAEEEQKARQEAGEAFPADYENALSELGVETEAQDEEI